MRLSRIFLLALLFVQSAVGEVSDEKAARFGAVAAGEYHRRFLEAIEAGKLDFPATIVPAEIATDVRAKAYFQAGFFRGVAEYRFESGLKKTHSRHPGIPLRGVFKWEQEGFIKGCAAAMEVGSAIQMDIQEIALRELLRDDQTPESAIEAAIRVIEKQQSDREREEQQESPGKPAIESKPDGRNRPEADSGVRPE